ncbi:MAG: DUF4244 domain-containing protein [Ilumatobacteraceae bacterium]
MTPSPLAHHLAAPRPLGRCRRMQARVHAAMLAAAPPNHRHSTGAARDRGQATTEYALVLLGAALVALLLVAWASSGGSAGRIGRLFDRVIDSIIQKL